MRNAQLLSYGLAKRASQNQAGVRFHGWSSNKFTENPYHYTACLQLIKSTIKRLFDPKLLLILRGAFASARRAYLVGFTGTCYTYPVLSMRITVTRRAVI
jgi:hypothetical protein